MKKDITICIGTVESPTFKKCYKIASKIAKNAKNSEKKRSLTVRPRARRAPRLGVLRFREKKGLKCFLETEYEQKPNKHKRATIG